MWILYLMVVNMFDPNDIPGRIQLQFSSHQSCEVALQNMNYWVKFPWFKVEGKCEKNTDNNRQPTKSN